MMMAVVVVPLSKSLMGSVTEESHLRSFHGHREEMLLVIPHENVYCTAVVQRYFEIGLRCW